MQRLIPFLLAQIFLVMWSPAFAGLGDADPLLARCVSKMDPWSFEVNLYQKSGKQEFYIKGVKSDGGFGPIDCKVEPVRNHTSHWICPSEVQVVSIERVRDVGNFETLPRIWLRGGDSNPTELTHLASFTRFYPDHVDTHPLVCGMSEAR